MVIVPIIFYFDPLISFISLRSGNAPILFLELLLQGYGGGRQNCKIQFLVQVKILSKDIGAVT